MSKIRVGNEIIDLAQCFAITVTETEIHFESGSFRLFFQKGRELSDQDFTTLSSYLTNQANNPYTVVVA